eukprot:SAG25_NODE_28_length_20925_cov_13.342839_2_plen_118_part_00
MYVMVVDSSGRSILEAKQKTTAASPRSSIAAQGNPAQGARRRDRSRQPGQGARSGGGGEHAPLHPHAPKRNLTTEMHAPPACDGTPASQPAAKLLAERPPLHTLDSEELIKWAREYV